MGYKVVNKEKTDHLERLLPSCGREMNYINFFPFYSTTETLIFDATAYVSGTAFKPKVTNVAKMLILNHLEDFLLLSFKWENTTQF